MKQEKTLCSKCAAILAEHYKVAEVSRREKVECENCGKRRYGCRCAVEKKG